jgi:high-affinity iron transporter
MRYLFTVVLLICSWISPQSYASGTDYTSVMASLIAKGDQQVSAYQPDDSIEQGKAFSNLYFGGFEGMGLELAVGQASQETMLTIEMQFSQLINAAIKGEPKSVIQTRWATLRTTLENAPLIENQNSVSTIIQSFLILLREGAEAMLVVAALITYLRRSGAGDQTPWIWGGVVIAIVLSALTAWLMQAVIKLQSGATREMIEGASMLLAAVMLSYVSMWLFARREISKWSQMIHRQLGEALSLGQRWTLVGIAFLSVYREGAETVLFYQALISNAAGQMSDVYIGVALALAALLGVYGLVVMASVKLPLKAFFSTSAIVLYLLSIIFTGKAVLELQVAGMVPMTEVSGPTITWLGVFPTWEGLASQLAMCLLPILLNFCFSLWNKMSLKQQQALDV